MPKFSIIHLTGEDTEKFLQGQITCNVKKIDHNYQATSICNLKGRVDYGFWLNKTEQQFNIVISQDCVEQLIQHIKKYAAFSKVTCSNAEPIYAYTTDDTPNFSTDAEQEDTQSWMQYSIATGNYWITEATMGLFAPQGLRLHQRGGVDYDKGCYLGQEVIARIYFKAAPKAVLHRICATGQAPEPASSLGKFKVLNALQVSDNKFEALVVGRFEHLDDSVEVLPLPAPLQADVARNTN